MTRREDVAIGFPRSLRFKNVLEPQVDDLTLIDGAEKARCDDSRELVEHARAIRKELTLPVVPDRRRVGLRVAEPRFQDERPVPLRAIHQGAASPTGKSAHTGLHPDPGQRSVA